MHTNSINKGKQMIAVHTFPPSMLGRKPRNQPQTLAKHPLHNEELLISNLIFALVSINVSTSLTVFSMALTPLIAISPVKSVDPHSVAG